MLSLISTTLMVEKPILASGIKSPNDISQLGTGGKRK